MAAYVSVVSARTTAPDLPAVLTSLRASVASDVGIQMVDLQHYTLKKSADWQPADVSTAQAIIDAAPALTPERDAQNQIDTWPIALRSLALTLLDQINILRGNDGLSTVTPGQALAAIRAKAGTL